MSIPGGLPGHPLDFSVGPEQKMDDLRQAWREIELLKTMDPFRAAEMAIEIQLERMRVVEALTARDTVVQRLTDAHVSIRQKAARIDCLELELEELWRRLSTAKDPCQDDHEIINNQTDLEMERLQKTIDSLREELRLLKEGRVDNGKPSSDPPPRYEEGKEESAELSSPFQNDIEKAAIPKPGPSLHFTQENADTVGGLSYSAVIRSDIPIGAQGLPQGKVNTTSIASTSDEPQDRISVRHSILAALPIPSDIPEDALKPITIPAPFNLHEFLGNTTGSLKNSLSNYRVFQQLTTSWCPLREEHGYLLTPLFKCNTNPRVTTAHRWTAVDVVARMNKPTECFYNKDGQWYYAGVYQAFRLGDLSTKEWEALSSETSQMLVKETITGRKNTSPQNMYETAQLYSAGALKVACIGLQCVGFNNVLYRTICAQSGKWKSAGDGSSGSGSGLGTGGAWNASTSSTSGGLVNDANKRAEGSENIPAM